jgi:3-hydroxyisobutyrate dehydrogenase-like beta-hydroxyacid dehydrogenase
VAHAEPVVEQGAGQVYGFAVDLMRKDLAIALEEARRNGSELPLAALVDQFFAELQRKGGGRLDVSSLLARFTDS